MAKSASPSYPRPTEDVAEKKVLPPSKARAGLLDTDTLYMMIVGTVLTIVLFGVIFFAYWRV
jgi:hypothetical protein